MIVDYDMKLERQIKYKMVLESNTFLCVCVCVCVCVGGGGGGGGGGGSISIFPKITNGISGYLLQHKNEFSRKIWIYIRVKKINLITSVGTKWLTFF